ALSLSLLSAASPSPSPPSSTTAPLRCRRHRPLLRRRPARSLSRGSRSHAAWSGGGCAATLRPGGLAPSPRGAATTAPPHAAHRRRPKPSPPHRAPSPAMRSPPCHAAARDSAAHRSIEPRRGPVAARAGSVFSPSAPAPQAQPQLQHAGRYGFPAPPPYLSARGAAAMGKSRQLNGGWSIDDGHVRIPSPVPSLDARRSSTAVVAPPLLHLSYSATSVRPRTPILFPLSRAREPFLYCQICSSLLYSLFFFNLQTIW
ncbi:unnamed protein product, partial [Urochloa humidicola]